MAVVVNPPNAALAAVPIGSRLWFSGYAVVERFNPFDYHRRMHFVLRTDERGPLLFAAMTGESLSGDAFLGIPLNVRSHCSAVSPANDKSSTGKPCSIRVERFEIEIAADAPVTLEQNSEARATIDGNSYDLSLSDAQYLTYLDAGCGPEDWAPHLSLQFSLAAEDIAGLLANQPVFPEKLPACRLGTDAPPFQLDFDALNWNALPARPFEVPLSISGSDANSIAFEVLGFGTLTASGVSAAARRVLERGAAFSMLGSGQYVIRDGNGGNVLAFSVEDSTSMLAKRAQEVLGISLTTEPRCEWMAAVCGSASESLYDVLYSDSPSHRVGSHERGTLVSSAGSFESWVGITPSCQADPKVRAAFVALE